MRINLVLAQLDILFCIVHLDIIQESFLYRFLLYLSLQIINLQLRKSPKFQQETCPITRFFNHLHFPTITFYFIIKDQNNANMTLLYYYDSKRVFYKASQVDREYLI